MEEKNGRIVGIVESTEVQKQQKKNKRSLRIMIASLILAGSVGYGAMNLSQGDSKEEQPAVSTEYQMSSEFDGVENSNISTDKANVVRVDNREDAISALMSTGMSKEEALEKIRAAEEQAAREKGAITEEEFAKELQHSSSEQGVTGAVQQAGSDENEKASPELNSSTVGFTEYMNEKVQDKVNIFNEHAQNVTSQDVLTDQQISELSQQAQNTVKSIYEDKFNALHDYQETVQPNQPSFPSIQSPVLDERQQFLDEINQKITEMNQMLDNTDVNEQSVSEGKTR